MSRFWIIARREYLYNLRRPSFLFATFGTPLFIIGIWFVIFLIGPGDDESTVDLTQFGYVDQAGLLTYTEPQTVASTLDNGDDTTNYTFTPYDTQEAARAALEDGEIGAYFVITETYNEDRSVERYGVEGLPLDINGAFRRLLLIEFSQGLAIEDDLRQRIPDPVVDFTLFLRDSGRELTQDALPVLLLTPFFFAIVFFIALQTTSGFLMNGLVEEKKNRILEIIVTTVPPMQLLLGKIIGMGLLGLTQIVIWSSAVIGVFIFGPEIELLSGLEGVVIPFDLILIGLVFFALGYFMVGSLLSVIGVLAGSEQQSNQYAIFVTLPGYIIPLALSVTFITDSNSPLVVFLSLFPITSPISMIMRSGFGAVPLWQYALSAGILLATTLVAVWISAKLFRWGLLLYGKKFTWRDLLYVIRSRGEVDVVRSQIETVGKEA